MYTFKGTYSGQGTNPEFPFLFVDQNQSTCGKNHYFVDIPHDNSLFHFMEMNLETETENVSPFKTGQLDGKFNSCFAFEAFWTQFLRICGLSVRGFDQYGFDWQLSGIQFALGIFKLGRCQICLHKVSSKHLWWHQIFARYK